MNKDTMCKSVFKGKTNKIRAENFTKKWIEIINHSENNKGINFSKSSDKPKQARYNCN